MGNRPTNEEIVRRYAAASAASDLDALAGLRHPDWSVSPQELARVPGWTPEFDLQSGFADAVAWYRTAGWLPA